jgi:hypothetical protein
LELNGSDGKDPADLITNHKRQRVSIKSHQWLSCSFCTTSSITSPWTGWDAWQSEELFQDDLLNVMYQFAQHVCMPRQHVDHGDPKQPRNKMRNSNLQLNLVK